MCEGKGSAVIVYTKCWGSLHHLVLPNISMWCTIMGGANLVYYYYIVSFLSTSLDV